MDSLSQAALGGAIGQAVLGRQVGRKAAVLGAVVATLPDLDVFVPLGNDVLEFTAHRSATHSLPLLALATPGIAWAIARVRRADAEERRRWFWLVGLCLWTHALLDAFTVYGTQLLWPFSNYPVAWNSIFIIDPAYTLPLVLGLGVALTRPTRWRWNRAGLLISTAYLMWTIVAQELVLAQAHSSLPSPGNRVLATPAPLQSLLWRVLVMTPDGAYLEGYHSLVDGRDGAIEFATFDAGHDLLAPVADSWAVRRLQWFTQGFYAARLRSDTLLVEDLRMGAEPAYVFTFAVGRVRADGVEALPGEQVQGGERSLSDLAWVWRRMWSDTGLPQQPGDGVSTQ